MQLRADLTPVLGTLLPYPHLSAYWRGVTTSTQLGWGKPDTIIPVNCGELYQPALVNATLQVINRCGYAPALEKPQEFLQAVRDFLAKE